MISHATLPEWKKGLIGTALLEFYKDRNETDKRLIIGILVNDLGISKEAIRARGIETV